MHTSEYEQLDGVALAALLDAGEVSAHELMACAVALAQQRAPQRNALTYERYEESLELARHWQPRGVFGGIPFLLKDSGGASRRFPSSLGSRLFDGMTYASNTNLIERFEQAGLIPFARTTVPELCMATTTEATRNQGPTRNPWDPTRSAGGSSGGAAVAVATGIVPVAHASDGGGSIRIPASCCGVFGLKPSRGLMPTGPLKGEGWGSLSVEGVLSRSVRDTAAALDATAGQDAGAPYAAPAFANSFQEAIRRGPGRPLRIGVWRTPFAGLAIDAECLRALDKTAQLCKSLGHQLIELATPAFDYDGLVQAHSDVLATHIVLSTQARLQTLGRALRDDDLEPALRDGYEVGRALPATAYAAAIARFHQVGRWMHSQMAGVDLLLTPGILRPPAHLGELVMQGGFREFRHRISRYSCFIALLNASGQPAASLPTHWTDARLPIGTQLVGPHGDDDLVLQLAAQLEQTGAWQPQHGVAQ
jgi:amidase